MFNTGKTIKIVTCAVMCGLLSVRVNAAASETVLSSRPSFIGVGVQSSMRSPDTFVLIGGNNLERGQLLIGMTQGDGRKDASEFVADRLVAEFEDRSEQNVGDALSGTISSIDRAYNQQFIDAYQGDSPHLLKCSPHYLEKGGECSATVLTVFLNRKEFFLAHLGDLRLYVLKRDLHAWIQLTEDHLIMSDHDESKELKRLLALGLSREQINSPLLTRYIGAMRNKAQYADYFPDCPVKDEMRSVPDIGKGALTHDYRALLLLCPEAIQHYNMREGTEEAAMNAIAKIVGNLLSCQDKTAQDAADAVVRYADNASAVVFDLDAWHQHCSKKQTEC